MSVIKEIREVVDGPISIDMPASLFHRKVEVIVIPLDEISSDDNFIAGNAWPYGFFEKTAGCMAEDPIRRPDQGEYEQREPLA
jgi:hypothetical protein